MHICVFLLSHQLVIVCVGETEPVPDHLGLLDDIGDGKTPSVRMCMALRYDTNHIEISPHGVIVGGSCAVNVRNRDCPYVACVR